MICKICHSVENIRNIDIYIIGSEGLDICHDCEMQIVEYIRQMMRLASISRKNVYKFDNSKFPYPPGARYGLAKRNFIKNEF